MNDLIGKSLDRYRLDALLAEGGMGAIFKAYDVTLQRHVALKIMHPHFARQPDFQERFLQEARSAARLNHPNIVRVYDFGEALTHLYIVMEFIPGHNLRRILQDLKAAGKWIVLPEALNMVREISLGLHCAHQAGVLHRDIKPENIMLKAEASESLPYRPVITDLGLAKLAGGAGITQVGTSLGTPAYMSPEQTLGEQTDARSDVYALGILLYELAVGRLPFPVRNLSDAIRYHTRESPPPPRSARPEMPASLEHAILTALQKQPQSRYASAEALATAIAQTLREMAQVGAGPSELAGVIPTPQETRSSQEPAATQLAGGRGTLPTPDQDRISIRAHDQSTRLVALSPAGLTIGRSTENDVVLNHPTVSRRHARIEFDGDNYSVVDLRSTNGTFLGDVRLLPAVANVWTADKTLRIGDNWLTLQRVRTRPKEADVTQEIAPPEETRIVGSQPEPSARRVSIFLDTNELSVDPGGQTTALATILNEGPLVDHFLVTVSGIPTDWVRVPTSPVRLLNGQQQDVQIIIEPPRTPKSQAGPHPIQIRATSRDAPTSYAQAQASITVSPFYDLAIDLRPRKQAGMRNAAFQLHLSNASNTQLGVRLDAADPESRCDFRFEAPYVTLGAGHERSVQLQVSSTAPIVGESARVYPFSVYARASEAPEVLAEVHGEWSQTPPRLEVSIQPPIQKSAGDAKYNLRVHNAGTADQSVRLSASDPEQGLAYRFTPQETMIPAGQVCVVELLVRPRLTLPSDQPRSHHFTVSACPGDMEAMARYATAEYQQLPPTFDLSIRPARSSSVSEAAYTLQIANASSADLTVALEARDPEEGCSYTFSPSSAFVPAGQYRSVQLLVRATSPLRGEGSRTFPFVVTAAPTGSPLLARQISGEFVQVPPTFDLAISPARLSSAGEGSFEIHLRNESDAVLTMQLQAADSQMMCEFDFASGTVAVPPGRSEKVGLRVRPKVRLRGDEPQSHRFAVTARPVEAPAHSKQEQAEWEQLPTRRLALGFVLPVLLTVLGWLSAYVLGLIVTPIARDALAGTGIYDVYELEFALPWGILGLVVGVIGGLLTGLSLLLAVPKFGFGRVLGVLFGWMLCWVVAHGALPFVVYGLDLADPHLSAATELNLVGLWAAFGAVAGLAGGSLMARVVKGAQPAARAWLIALTWSLAFAIGEIAMAFVDSFWPLIDQVHNLGFRDRPDLLVPLALVGLIAGTIGSLLTFWHLSRVRNAS